MNKLVGTFLGDEFTDGSGIGTIAPSLGSSLGTRTAGARQLAGLIGSGRGVAGFIAWGVELSYI